MYEQPFKLQACSVSPVSGRAIRFRLAGRRVREVLPGRDAASTDSAGTNGKKGEITTAYSEAPATAEAKKHISAVVWASFGGSFSGVSYSCIFESTLKARPTSSGLTALPTAQ